MNVGVRGSYDRTSDHGHVRNEYIAPAPRLLSPPLHRSTSPVHLRTRKGVHPRDLFELLPAFYAERFMTLERTSLHSLSPPLCD